VKHVHFAGQKCGKTESWDSTILPSQRRSMFILRTNRLTRFGVYKNVNDVAVVAQEA
jgi:hypothetical protein